MSKKRSVSLDDLPPRYRAQAAAQIDAARAATDNKPRDSHALAGAKEAARRYGPIGGRVTIEYHSYRARLADADGNFTKYFTDALVSAGVLVDDSPEYVSYIGHRQTKCKEEKVVIEIWSDD